MGVLFTNNASTTLSAAISSTSATSISVASSSTFPAPGAGEYFYATIDDTSNIEIVKVTAVSGTTWTVVRGADNTTAATFANGTTVQLRAAAALLTDIQQNIAAKSANQTVYNATTASNATSYDVGTNPQNENNAMVFLDGVMQHHDTFSFSGSTLTFDAAPSNGLKLEVIIDNLINLQSSNLTVDTFTATNGQTAFTLSDTPAAEDNLIVFIEGVFQNQDSYTISNNVLTMSAGVTTGRKVVVYVINPVNIGTPSDGTVTSAKLSGNITMPGTLTVGSNDVAFDSPTFVVDNANSRVGLGTASPSVPVDIVGDVKMSSTLELTSHLDMPDDAYLKIGTGDDLQIYHNASDSIIRDVGTGRLLLGASELLVTNSGLSEAQIQSLEDGAVTLYHNGNAKLATASDGVDITGPNLDITADDARLLVEEADGTNIGWFGDITGEGVGGAFLYNHGGTATVQLRADATAGFINNGANFGIGTASPARELHVHKASSGATSTSNSVLVVEDDDNTELSILGGSSSVLAINFGHSGDNDEGIISFNTTSGSENLGLSSSKDITHTVTSTNSTAGHHIFKSYNTEIMRINGANNRVGIGTTSPEDKLQVKGGDISIVSTNGGSRSFAFTSSAVEGTYVAKIESDHTANWGANLKFFTGPSGGGNAERMRIDESGNVGIGNTNPGGMHSSVRRLVVGSGSGNQGLSIYSGSSSEGTIGFARDIAGNSDAYDGIIEYSQADRSMRFGTNAGTERMRLKTGLSIGTSTDPGSQNLLVAGVMKVGTNSPSVSGLVSIQDGNPGVPALFVYNTNTDSVGIRSQVNSTAASNYIFAAYNSGGIKWKIRNDGDHQGTDTSIGSISDSRTKKDVSDLTYDIDKFKQYRPITFNWINPECHNHKDNNRGFLAQEVKAIDDFYCDKYEATGDDIPLVDEDGMAHGTKFGYKDAMYVSVIQQLITRLEDAEARITELESS